MVENHSWSLLLRVVEILLLVHAHPDVAELRVEILQAPAGVKRCDVIARSRCTHSHSLLGSRLLLVAVEVDDSNKGVHFMVCDS